MRGVVPIRLPMEPKLGSLSSDNYHPVVKTSPLACTVSRSNQIYR